MGNCAWHQIRYPVSICEVQINVQSAHAYLQSDYKVLTAKRVVAKVLY